MVRSQIKSYDELESELNDFLNNDTSSEDEDDEKPVKKKKLIRLNLLKGEVSKEEKARRYLSLTYNRI